MTSSAPKPLWRKLAPLDVLTGVLLVVVCWLGVKMLITPARQPPSEDSNAAAIPYENAMLGQPAPTIALLSRDAQGLDSIRLRSLGNVMIGVGERSCAACQFTVPVWAELSRSESLAQRVIVVTPDSDPLALPPDLSHARTFRTADFGGMVRGFNSPGYPLTLVTDPTGIVRFARIGTMHSGDRERIRSLLDRPAN